MPYIDRKENYINKLGSYKDKKDMETLITTKIKNSVNPS